MTDGLNPLINLNDLDEYEQHLQSLQQGLLDPHRFVGIRLNLGIYAQRQDGMCMVRAKLPGGRLTPRQLLGFAEGAEHYSATDSVHLTTRQDIQFHFVALEQTPKLQHHLAAYNIATREAGGNTVRNITGCALSGACPGENVDITPYVEKTSQYFVRHPLTQALPRKFKISFSGCASDCANGLVHDLGVVATQQDGEPGFRLLAGGGLGSKPMEAIELRRFVPEALLIPAVEAVLALHDKYSDRKRRMRSRIKFVVADKGAEEFGKLFDKEFERTTSAFSPENAPLAEWRQPSPQPDNYALALRGPVEQHQEGLVVLPIHVPYGKLLLAQLRDLADLMTREGLTELRATTDQNLCLFNIPADRLAHITAALEKMDLKPPKCGDWVVSCPGTSTCPMGITASREIASRLSGGVSDLAVRINGCQNACANANISDIGLYGKGRRHHGKLVPSYTLLLGGDGSSDGGSLGIKGPDIPAVRTPMAVQLIHDRYHADSKKDESFRQWARREGKEYFDNLLSSLSTVGPMELFFLVREHGDSRVFKVEAQGIGECAGTQAAPADKLLLDARYESELSTAFAAKNKYTEAAECVDGQILLSGRSLLAAIQDDRHLSEFNALQLALKEHYAAETALLDGLERLCNQHRSFTDNPDELQYPALAEAANAWTALAQKCLDHIHAAAHTEELKRSGTDG
jgi:sulfite reductase beta subunit-like hemoprotein|tara:strand:+ start:172 stop:2235 length:2064 start_codon:yes stop_codon:yes gene_type:complete